MRLVSMFSLRLRSLFSRNKVEQELDEELRYHLERQIEEGIAAGMTPEDALRRAPIHQRYRAKERGVP